MSFNVVLDIDGVLASRHVNGLAQVQYFKNKGAIITALKTHYIFPGVIEFIRFLAREEGVKLSFFSAGIEERNKIFVAELLKLALTEQEYQEKKEKIRIFSRQHLVCASAEEKEEHKRVYNLFNGNWQKNLNVVLEAGDKLENTVLIDDDSSIVAFGQAKNIIYIPHSRENHYEALNMKTESYEPEGYKFLDCVFASFEYRAMIDKKKVEEKKLLMIAKTESGYDICYVDKTLHQYRRQRLSLENHPNLLVKLDVLHQENVIKYNGGCLITEKELIREIGLLVESLGGIAHKICRSANRIFLAAGLLATFIPAAKADKLPLSNYTFKLQFKKNSEKDAYETNFQKMSRMEQFYYLGLEKLREFNPGLELVSPHNYTAVAQIPDTKENLLALIDIFKNQETS